MVVKAKRSYSSGRHSVDFKILHLTSRNNGQVGVVDEYFDSKLIAYIPRAETAQTFTSLWPMLGLYGSVLFLFFFVLNTKISLLHP